MSDIRASNHLPELDGLRAVAISAVLLFHLDPSLLKGGFLGVDIFFVISGFLITWKIAPQIAEGRFSFGEFYLGRARRLVPVFLLTLMLTWLAAWWLLFPAELKSLSSTTLAALMGLANYQFSRRLDYFAPDLDAQPLLHTWSLAVEEQFY
jgi:peptidoglycan/LPS O-acetylase OafA/YrhL